MFCILFINSLLKFRNKSHLQGILDSGSFSEKKTNISIKKHFVTCHKSVTMILSVVLHCNLISHKEDRTQSGAGER